MAKLVPVDFDPFGGTAPAEEAVSKLVPVDFDPFATTPPDERELNLPPLQGQPVEGIPLPPVAERAPPLPVARPADLASAPEAGSLIAGLVGQSGAPVMPNIGLGGAPATPSTKSLSEQWNENLSAIPGALEAKKALQGFSLMEGQGAGEQVRRLETEYQNAKARGAGQSYLDALQHEIDVNKKAYEESQAKMPEKLAGIEQTEKQIEEQPKTEFSKIVAESRKTDKLADLAKGVYEGVTKDPAGALKDLTGTIIGGAPQVGATILGGGLGGGLFSAGVGYGEAIRDETIKRSPDPEKMRRDLANGDTTEFNKIYNKYRDEIQKTANDKGLLSGGFGYAFGVIPGAKSFWGGVKNLALKYAPLGVAQEAADRAITKVPVIDPQTGNPQLDEKGNVVLQDAEGMSPSDIAVAYGIGIATGIPFEAMHAPKAKGEAKPAVGEAPPAGEAAPREPSTAKPSAANDEATIFASYADDIQSGRMSREDVLNRIAGMSPDEIAERAKLTRQVGGKELKTSPLSAEDVSYIVRKRTEATAPAALPSPEKPVEAPGPEAAPAPEATYKVPLDEAALLKGAGYTVEDIATMGKRERKSQIKEAKENEIEPVDLTDEEKSSLAVAPPEAKPTPKPAPEAAPAPVAEPVDLAAQEEARRKEEATKRQERRKEVEDAISNDQREIDVIKETVPKANERINELSAELRRIEASEPNEFSLGARPDYAGIVAEINQIKEFVGNSGSEINRLNSRIEANKSELGGLQEPTVEAVPPEAPSAKAQQLVEQGVAPIEAMKQAAAKPVEAAAEPIPMPAPAPRAEEAIPMPAPAAEPIPAAEQVSVEENVPDEKIAHNIYVAKPNTPAQKIGNIYKVIPLNKSAYNKYLGYSVNPDGTKQTFEQYIEYFKNQNEPYPKYMMLRKNENYKNFKLSEVFLSAKDINDYFQSRVDKGWFLPVKDENSPEAQEWIGAKKPEETAATPREVVTEEPPLSEVRGNIYGSLYRDKFMSMMNDVPYAIKKFGSRNIKETGVAPIKMRVDPSALPSFTNKKDAIAELPKAIKEIIVGKDVYKGMNQKQVVAFNNVLSKIEQAGGKVITVGEPPVFEKTKRKRATNELGSFIAQLGGLRGTDIVTGRPIHELANVRDRKLPGLWRKDGGLELWDAFKSAIPNFYPQFEGQLEEARDYGSSKQKEMLDQFVRDLEKGGVYKGGKRAEETNMEKAAQAEQDRYEPYVNEIENALKESNIEKDPDIFDIAVMILERGEAADPYEAYEMATIDVIANDPSVAKPVIHDIVGDEYWSTLEKQMIPSEGEAIPAEVEPMEAGRAYEAEQPTAPKAGAISGEAGKPAEKPAPAKAPEGAGKGVEKPVTGKPEAEITIEQMQKMLDAKLREGYKVRPADNGKGILIKMPGIKDPAYLRFAEELPDWIDGLLRVTPDEAKGKAIGSTGLSIEHKLLPSLSPKTQAKKIAYVLKSYFTPGNIVHGYFGKDKVISFNENDNEHWSVTVQRINDDGTLEDRVRKHSTLPEKRELAQVLGKDYAKDWVVTGDLAKNKALLDKLGFEPTRTVDGVQQRIFIGDNPTQQILDAVKKPAEEKGAEGKPQLVLRGTEKIGQKEQLERQAAKPMRGAVEQKEPGGLFSDESKQKDIFDKYSAGYQSKIADQLPDVVGHIEDTVRRLVGDKLAVKFIDKLIMADAEAAEMSGAKLGDEAGGSYSHVDRLIKIAMDTPDPLMPLYTVHHELKHAMDYVLTPEEIKVLESNNDELKKMVTDFYEMSGEQFDGLAQDEKEAYAYGAYGYKRDRGEPVPSNAVGRVFGKMYKIWQRIKAAIRNFFGNKKVEDIFNDIYNGNLKSRMNNVRFDMQEMQNKQRFSSSFSKKTIDEINEMNKKNGMAPPPAKPAKVFEEGALSKIRRNFQDEFAALEKAQKYIVETRGAPLPDSMDALTRVNLMPGRTSARLQEFEQKEMEPLFKEMKKEGVTKDDLGEFLLGTYAPIRNAQMAKRDPKRFGLDGGSGIANKTAAEMVRKYDNRKDVMERLSKMVYDILERDIERRVEAGLYSEEEAAAFKEDPLYVPLYGFAEYEADEERHTGYNLGRGVSVSAKESPQAKGRRSIPGNPLVNAILKAEEGIYRAEKNRAAKALLTLARSNPNPELWEVNKPKLEKIIGEDGLVKWVFKGLAGPNTVIAKVGGKPYFIDLKNRGLVEAYKKMGVVELNDVLKNLSKATRVFSQLQTTKNPDFFGPNIIRDMTDALTNAHLEDPAIRNNMIKLFPRARRIVSQNIFGKLSEKNQKILDAYNEMNPDDQANEFDKLPERVQNKVLYDEWSKSGGKISYNIFRDDVNLSEELEKTVGNIDPSGWKYLPAKTRKKAMGLVKSMWEGLDKISQPFEEITRLLVYISARKIMVPDKTDPSKMVHKYSIDKAANFALNFSVNFYRKGKVSPMLNAAYAFFNAAVQGDVYLGSRLFGTKKGLKLTRNLFGFFMMLSLYNMLMSQDSEMEPDKSNYLDIPEIERATSFIVKYGRGKKDYFRIPNIPIFLSLKDLADQIVFVSLGQRKPGEALSSWAWNTFEAHNPFGDNSIVSAIWPTITKPFIDIAQNKNYFGSPIHPKEEPWNQGIPNYKQYFASTSPVATEFAKFLNAASFGTVDIYPNDAEYLVKSFTGGLGRTVGNIGKSFDTVLSGKEFKAQDVPILRRFVPGGWDESGQYYHLKEQFDGKMNQMRKEGEKTKGNRTAKAVRKADADLKSLRQDIVSVKNDNKMSPRQKQIAEEKIRAEMSAIMNSVGRDMAEYLKENPPE